MDPTSEPPLKKRKIDQNTIEADPATNDMEKSDVPPHHRRSGRAPTFLNESIIAYYKELGLIPDSEWDVFTETLKTDLPTTFRITSTSTYAPIIKQVFVDLFVNNPEMSTLEMEDKQVTVEPPRPLNWIPDQLGWHYSIFRKSFKKTPMLKIFKRFLTVESEIGKITRQEEVSMIPPVLLEVKPHHIVLDMCAAPGSKTAQLLEALHAGGEKLPTGCVVANELDMTRCYMLAHQTSRLGSPALIITNYEGQNYPVIQLPKIDNPTEYEPMYFDRILCDVPCSGDGTIRKNPNVGKGWNTRAAHKYHSIQVPIAKRGIQLLKKDGFIVYSTCSMNPIENEAVVAELLRSYDGKVELVDASEKMPGLKRLPGVSTWKVMDITHGKRYFYDKHEDVQPERRHRITATMFPPTVEEQKKFHLERCLRVYPHLQDTGGFFIALLKKTDEVLVEDKPYQPPKVETEDVLDDANFEEEEKSVDDDKKAENKEGANDEKTGKGNNNKNQKGGKNNRNRSKKPKLPYGSIDLKEEPFLPLTQQGVDLLKPLQQFYGVGEELTNTPNMKLITRSTQHNRVYYVTDIVYRVVMDHYKAVTEKKDCLRVINLGLRLFENQHKKNKKLGLECDWRPVPESLDFSRRFLKKRVIPMRKSDFLKFLSSSESIFFSNLSVDCRSALEFIGGGSCMFELIPEHDPNASTLTNTLYGQKLHFSGFRGKYSASLFLSKLEEESLRNIYLSSKYNHVSPPTHNSGEKKKDDEAAEENKEMKD
jgi:16S rRNA C967 or C1407 C5-methylase (RsmB/RsmF family)